MPSFRIFYEKEFDAVQASRYYDLRQRVERESVDYILNADEQQYIAHLASIYAFDPLELDLSNVVTSRHEMEVPAERFPQGYAVRAGGRYRKPVVRYHIPFTGDAELLRCSPNPRELNTFEVFVEDNAVCFDVIAFSDDPAPVIAAFDRNRGLIERQFTHLSKQIENHNRSIGANAQSIFHARKSEIQKQHDFLARLGVPVKKASGVPTTFTVPASRKKIVLDKPAIGQPATLDPVLSETIYEEILKVLQDTGRVFERLPSTYYDKDEETLRDHFLLQLEPHFEMASATGETFNKDGKTDILLRFEKHNVFVAECKVWHGPGQHGPTIDQLLKFITWRDSKTAIVYFVHNKKIIEVLEAIESETQKHPCFGRFIGKQEESLFRYDFHFPGDPDRHIKLNILCFHMPR